MGSYQLDGLSIVAWRRESDASIQKATGMFGGLSRDGYVHPEVSKAGGLLFVPSVDVDRFRVFSVGWSISLLIGGNA